MRDVRSILDDAYLRRLKTSNKVLGGRFRCRVTIEQTLPWSCRHCSPSIFGRMRPRFEDYDLKQRTELQHSRKWSICRKGSYVNIKLTRAILMVSS